MDLQRNLRDPEFIPESQQDLPSSHAPKRRWITIAFITVLWHLILFWYASDIRPPHLPQERTAIQQIDPQKLEAIRRQMKQRSLLLSKDKSPAEKTPEPKDARYDSDRNRIVKKEQRAARSDVMPDPGSESSPAQRKTDRQASQIPLSKLGAMSSLTQPQKKQSDTRRGAGVDQSLLEQNLPEGAENMLSTRESVYYTFYARIYETIGPLWQSKIRTLGGKRVPSGEYSTKVEVILDEDGNYVDAIIRQSSTIGEFDRTVTDAWKKIPRFPNPPRALIGSDGRVHMGWNFVVYVNDQGWNYQPPSRDESI